MLTMLDCPAPSSLKTTMRGLEAYIAARLSKSSLAAHASQIQIVGRRPVQNVIMGDLYSFASFSKYIQGFSAGSKCVFPIRGSGNGPGGCENFPRLDATSVYMILLSG